MNRMNNQIQKLIDETEYWDAEIMDLKAAFFGDEVEMFIDNDEETCWKICFSSCHKVLYETDANRRNITKVRDMRRSQLGYFGQDISVYKSENLNFYQVDLDLSIMEMHIECKDIFIEKISKSNLEFFWTQN